MIKLFLMIFLASGIPFGLIMGIITGLVLRNSIAGTFTGLISGIIFGSLVSIILGIFHIVSTRKTIRTVKRENVSLPSENSLWVHQKRVLKLNLTYDKAFDFCISSLAIIKATVKREDRASGNISGETRVTWKSWGENIQFRLHKIDNEMTQVEVLSKPALPTTLVDYGKNLENVGKLSEFLMDAK